MHCGVLAKLEPVANNNNSYITLCLIQIYELMVLYINICYLHQHDKNKIEKDKYCTGS